MNPQPSSLLGSLVNRVFSISRRTWILLSLGVLVLIALLIWATISLAGWLFGFAREGAAAVPDVARTAIEQVEKTIPGAGQALDELRAMVPLAAVPAGDVSGTDPMPVERFPGLLRVNWARDGENVNVRYAGRGAMAEVIEHYSKGFAAQGYRQELQTATQGEERHDFIKGDARFKLIFAQQKSEVSVQVTARQP